MKFKTVNYWYETCGLVLTLGLMIPAGCHKNTGMHVTPAGTVSNSTTCSRAQLDLILPAKIEVLPFTKPRSWDGDSIPDGIEVVLRPLDYFGDQTKAVGTFRFELYTFQKADSDPKGERFGFWQEDLTSRQAQEQHWDRITSTYRFRLGWSGPEARPGKYVLEVTYISPDGRRITSSYIMNARVPKEVYKEKIESNKKGNMNIF